MVHYGLYGLTYNPLEVNLPDFRTSVRNAKMHFGLDCFVEEIK